MGEPLDLVYVVVGGQLTCRSAESRRSSAVPAHIFAQIKRLTATVVGERRVRLVADTGLQAEFIDASAMLSSGASAGNSRPAASRKRGCGTSQALPESVHRAVQVVVLERRLVDLAGEGDFVLGVGLCRVEVLGPVGKGGIKDVAPGLGRRVGIVPGLAATGKAGNEQQLSRVFGHGAKCNNLTASLPIADNVQKNRERKRPMLDTKIPDFTLPATGGRHFNLAAQAGKIVVIYFYPGQHAGLHHRGAAVPRSPRPLVAVDAVIPRHFQGQREIARKLQGQQALPFELVSDADETVCKLFAVMKMKTCMASRSAASNAAPLSSTATGPAPRMARREGARTCRGSSRFHQDPLNPQPTHRAMTRKPANRQETRRHQAFRNLIPTC